MTPFPDSPSLPQLQSYLARVCSERGWDTADDLETFLLFSEEVGELAKAIRNARQLFSEKDRPPSHHLAEEMADVLSYLLDLANRFEVDLETALRAKEKVNQQRRWS